MNSNTSIVNENNFIIGSVNRGVSVYDYNNSNEVKVLLGLRDQIDTDMLTMLIEQGIVKLDNKTFEECRMENPILDQYNDWEKNWRTDSTSTAYTWRKNSEKFFSLRDKNVKGTLKDYLTHLSTFKVISYNDDESPGEILSKITVTKN